MNKNKKTWIHPGKKRNKSEVENPVNIEIENIMKSTKDEGSIDTAINNGANFFSNRNLA